MHVAAGGTCTVRASQAGDGSYNPASDVDQSFTVAKANQTITFGALANKTFGDADFGVGATASSGLTVSFSSQTSAICTVSGTSVHLAAGGTCTIRASQAGDGNYNMPLDAVTNSLKFALKDKPVRDFNPPSSAILN